MALISVGIIDLPSTLFVVFAVVVDVVVLVVVVLCGYIFVCLSVCSFPPPLSCTPFLYIYLFLALKVVVSELYSLLSHQPRSSKSCLPKTSVYMFVERQSQQLIAVRFCLQIVRIFFFFLSFLLSFFLSYI